MIRYNYNNADVELRVNGLFRNQVFFSLESIDSISTNEDENGLYSFTVILNNGTTIDFVRTNKIESTGMLNQILNNLINDLT